MEMLLHETRILLMVAALTERPLTPDESARLERLRRAERELRLMGDGLFAFKTPTIH